MNKDGYGGATDWLLLYEREFKRSGWVEINAHKFLNAFRVRENYIRLEHGYRVKAKELFCCNYADAYDAVERTLEQPLGNRFERFDAKENYNSEEILACEEAGITVTLPKPMTSNAKAEGRFGKQDFRYVAEDDVYICPAGERLAYSFTTSENGLVLRRYSTKACQSCAIKNSCTTGKERRITRWEHEHVLEAVQRRLDEHPEKMRQRRETVEHPFGTIKARMGATHFLMKTLPRVAAEMALHVLAYNLTRVMNIMGVQPLMAAMRA